MNRLDRLYEIADPIVIALAAVALLLLLTLLPRHWRVPVSLFGMSFTQTIARLPDLGAIATACLLAVGPFYLVVLACLLTERWRRVPFTIWTYLLLGSSSVVAIYFIKTPGASDVASIRALWVLLVVCAACVGSTITSQGRLLMVLKALCLGMGAGCIVAALPLALDPTRGIQAAYGRYMPYNANPNQVGTIFAAVAILGGYIWLCTSRSTSRTACGIACGIGFLLLAITVSRMAMLSVAVAYIALVPVIVRRPITSAIFACVLCVGAYKIVSIASATSFDRMALEDGRSQYWEIGLAHFSERPLLGCMETGTIVNLDEDDNMHNAYLGVVFLGGLAFAVPLFSCQIRGVIAGFQLWIQRGKGRFEVHGVRVCLAYLVTLTISGFANEILLYPVYTAAFLNVLLGTFFLSQLRLTTLPCVETGSRTQMSPQRHSDVLFARAPRSHRKAA